jgi:hypothetical protein
MILGPWTLAGLIYLRETLAGLVVDVDGYTRDTKQGSRSPSPRGTMAAAYYAIGRP